MHGLAKLAASPVTIPTTPEEVKQFKQERKDKGQISRIVHNYLKKNYPEDCIYWAKLLNWKLVERVPLEKIKMQRRPGGAREKDKVKGIAGAVKEGKPMEPVVLVRLPDGTIKIADGYHRTLGFKHAGKTTVKAWIADVPVYEGPWDKEMHEKKLNIGKKAAGEEEDSNLLPKEGSLLGLLGLGAALHVAPNLAMKAVKSTKRGHDALTGTFSAGLDMGRTGRKLHPNAESLMTYGIGPESLVEYKLGRKVGERMSGMDPDRQERFLQKTLGMAQAGLGRTNKLDSVDHVPLLGTGKSYLEGRGENKVKNAFMKMSVPQDQPVTWKHKAGNLAALGGAAAIDPHLLLQPAISGARQAAGRSELGRQFIDRQFKNGLEGKPLSKAKERVIDMAVSPSALDPYRVGRYGNEKLPSPANETVQKKVNLATMLSPANK